MSSPTAPRVDPLAWEEEATKERVQRRAQHLHLANDQDPKKKSIAQQAMPLAGPLADIEDPILHMDGFSFGNPDAELFDCHNTVLRKMRSERAKMASLRTIKGEPANHNVSAPMKRATASSTASPTSLLVKLTGLALFGSF